MADVKIYKRRFYIFIFAKVWLMRTILTQKHTQTDTEMDKPMAIGEILQICLKNTV